MAIEESSKVLAVSHIDTDGITSLAIVISMLQRAEKTVHWQNIHQLNSETILEIKQLVKEHKPDLVIFSDLGTGQMHLIEEHIAPENVDKIIVLDHHLPSDSRQRLPESSEESKIIEINPCQHNMSGSYDISAAGVCFLQAYTLSKDNAGLSELAIVGASGDLQDYYGKGFTGLNKEIVSLGASIGCIQVDRDLTFFGINTRPLPFLLEYATDPYLPGITGAREAVYSFYEDLKIPLKTSDDQWRIWVDLSSEEKQRVVQGLIDLILETYENP
ncbi:MAG: DHH family phosphoesterase, partial [Candidatus Thorarchaeota archaeon]